MVLWIWDKVKFLSRRQLRVICLTAILPALVSVIIPLSPSCIADHWLVRWIPLAVFPVWAFFALMSVASMLKDESIRAERDVEKKLGVLSDDVKDLETRRLEAEAGLQTEIANYYSDMREGFRQLGVPIMHRIRAEPITGQVNVSQPSLVVTRTKLKGVKRLLSWMLRAARTFRRWVWG